MRLSIMAMDEVQGKLRSLADPERAGILQRFFKTGPGEYGEGKVSRGKEEALFRGEDLASAIQLEF
jgi:hypothetical protein